MNDILYIIAMVLLYLGTIWTYERRLLGLEDLLHLQFTEPEFDTAARQAMAVANAARNERDLTSDELDELLAPYKAAALAKPTDTTLDDYTAQPGERMLRLLDSLHEDEEPQVVGPAAFSQDEIDRYN